MNRTFWTLNTQEYFEAPGLAVMVFHDDYPEGKQGGISIIQHGERIASCGDLRMHISPGQWAPLPDPQKREIDGSRVCVHSEFTKAGVRYSVAVYPGGKDIIISVELDQAQTIDTHGNIGFNLELFPSSLAGMPYILGDYAGVFPTQADGKTGAQAMATGKSLHVMPDNPATNFSVISETGELKLYDGREAALNGWFVLRETLSPDAGTQALRWRIQLGTDPSWRRKPVLCLSQLGYHPDQQKRLVIELDHRTRKFRTAVLKKITPSGAVSVLKAKVLEWGRWLCYTYAVFDFSTVREEGMYRIEYDGQETHAFAIRRNIYRNGAWQPTLSTFFPVQMCHVEVRSGTRVWHGACHLDDALQAPVHHSHFDGYHQYDNTETPYTPGEHIPCLAEGGWHDAGDYDLAAGSQAKTARTLALVRELFSVDNDTFTVDKKRKLVTLNEPDGIPDIVEQVEHGVLNLLSGYRATAGQEHSHSFHGIIEGTIRQYAHTGDAATMTDNCVHDPALSPGRLRLDNNGTLYSGNNDDRWAFTNHDTALEYRVAAALAASSRVLWGYNDSLSAECLETAKRVWDYESKNAQIIQPAAYVPVDMKTERLVATAELLVTTGEDRYRDALVEDSLTGEWPVLGAGGAIARALAFIRDTEYYSHFQALLSKEMSTLSRDFAQNPFGIRWEPRIWGVGWQLQAYAVELFQLWRVFPDLIDRETVLRVVNFVLGCHPASSISLVSGVGAKSVTSAYGVNRADWSYIPGGMISGVALVRPDFPELKTPFPHLWQQTEYVISGAADYIFCILAADTMLSNTCSQRTTI